MDAARPGGGQRAPLPLALLVPLALVAGCTSPQEPATPRDGPRGPDEVPPVVADRAGEAPAMAAGPATASVAARTRPSPPPQAAVLDRLLRTARAQGLVRVMVEIRGSQPGELLEEEEIQRGQDAFLDLLADNLPREQRRMTRFDRIPFLALDVDADDVQNLIDVGPELFRDYAIGLDVVLKEQRAPAAGPPAVGDYTLEEVVGFVQGAGAGGLGLGAGQAIVLLDTGLDPSFYLIDGSIRGGSFQTVGLGSAVCFELGETTWRGDPSHAAIPAPSLGLSHGTQVAVVACASDDTDPALAGVAPSVAVVAMRLEESEGDVLTSTVVQGLYEVFCYWKDGSGLDVAAVSISLGTDSVYPTPCGSDPLVLAEIGPSASAMWWAVELLRLVDVPVVVGAGNDSEDLLAFPACLEGTVSVVATDGADDPLFWSNWDAAADLAAPGATILVPRPGSSTPIGLGPGTSIAAPVVAGAVAILREAFPDCTTEQIVEALRASSKTVPAAGTTSHPAVPFVQLEDARDYLMEVCAPSTPEPEPGPEPGEESETDTEPEPPEVKAGVGPPR